MNMKLSNYFFAECQVYGTRQTWSCAECRIVALGKHRALPSTRSRALGIHGPLLSARSVALGKPYIWPTFQSLFFFLPITPPHLHFTHASAERIPPTRLVVVSPPSSHTPVAASPLSSGHGRPPPRLLLGMRHRHQGLSGGRLASTTYFFRYNQNLLQFLLD